MNEYDEFRECPFLSFVRRWRWRLALPYRWYKAKAYQAYIWNKKRTTPHAIFKTDKLEILMFNPVFQMETERREGEVEIKMEGKTYEGDDFQMSFL